MVQAVALPDGNLVNFPDEMSQEDITKAMPQAYKQYQSSQAQNKTPTEDLPQPGDTNFIENVGQKETQNLKAAGNDLAQVVQPFHKDNSPGPAWLQAIGQYPGNVISGVAGAVFSPITSTAEGAAKSIANTTYQLGAPEGAGPIPQEELQKADKTTDAIGSTAANVGTALLGAEKVTGSPAITAENVANALKDESSTGPTFKSVGDIKDSIVNSKPGKFFSSMGEDSASQKVPNEAPPEEYAFLKDAAKGTGIGSTKADSSMSGRRTIEKASKSYDKINTLKNDTYDALNEKGGQFSLNTPEVYKNLTETISELDGKVALGTKEYRALEELKDIHKNLKDSFSVEAQPAKVSSIVDSESKPIVKETAKAGVEAYGAKPSDLLDIKSALTDLINSDTFTTKGTDKLIALKKAASKDLESAGKIDPEFGALQAKAEGLNTFIHENYKNEAISDIFSPRDFSAWKRAQNAGVDTSKTDAWMPPDMKSRAGEVLNKLNDSNEGRISALKNVLSPEDLDTVYHDAIQYGKERTPFFANNRWVAKQLTTHPIASAKGLIGAATRSTNPIIRDSALLKQVAKQQEAAGSSPASQATKAALSAAVAGGAYGAKQFLAPSLEKRAGQNNKDQLKSSGASKLQLKSDGDTHDSSSSSINIDNKSNNDTSKPGSGSKKKSSSIDTSYFVNNLDLKNDTQRAVAKSNADTIVKTAQEQGVDPVHYLKMAASESRIGASDATGKKGIFQVTDNSYKLLKQKYPEQMKGLNRDNTADNMKMTMLLGKSDAEDFKKSTGKDPSPEEQRLLHVLGLGSTIAVTQNQGKKIAARGLSDSLQKASESNPNLFIKDNKNVTPSLLKENIIKDYNKWNKYITASNND